MKKGIKKKIIVGSGIALVILVSLIVFYFSLSKDFTCTDGTENNECSEIKPYYCLNGKFVKNVSSCGCSGFSKVEGNNCISSYETEAAENIALNYTLRGKIGSIDFRVYKGVYDRILKIPRSIDSSEDPTLLDFKLKNLEEQFQEEFLFPLVIQIENITSNREDQARIAISLIQNIPFGESNRSFSFSKNNKIEYQRYAYEVLYDFEGICSEKSALLIFLLEKLGYGTAFIYYPKENHEATGIKCADSKSVNNTGYCFIETTGPSIITDDKTEFVGEVSLSSTPQIIIISGGNSFEKNMYEYNDARNLIQIRETMRKYGAITVAQSIQFNYLEKKYGLIDFYSYEF